MAKKFTRRDFLKGGIIVVGGSVLAAVVQFLRNNPLNRIATQVIDTEVFTPLAYEEPEQAIATTEHPTKNPDPEPATETMEEPTVTATESEPQQVEDTTSLIGIPGDAGAKFPGRVVQVHHKGVHTWNYSDLNYWDAVDQSVVDEMFDEGLKHLTGENSLTDTWRALIPNYIAGQVVAIKVSFNNSHDAAGSIEEIDGIIEPVNSIIRGLNAIGVPNSSIVVYDSSRWIPTRFINGCDYDGVVFRHQNDDPWGEGAAEVEFSPPGVNSFTKPLSKEVAQANYLINVPVLKAHGMTKLSLAMKNHYGSIYKPKDLHQWSSIGSEEFSLSYNPFVDIYNNRHIRDKTILTVGDSIFAAFRNHDVRSFPRPWVTFDNETPKSLFFATDPVAIDCVMGDVLSFENVALGKGEINQNGFTYLSLAESVGLGVYERGNPWENSYSKIDFISREL